MFIDAGANLKMVNNDGESPLHLAGKLQFCNFK